MARAGHPMSAAARAKLSASLKGKPHPHKGHPLSAAARAKISAALKARHGGTHTTRPRGGGHRGHPMSAETRAKISAALRARHAGHTTAPRSTTHTARHTGTHAHHTGPGGATPRGHGVAAAHPKHHRPKHVLGAKLGRPHRPHRSAFSKVSSGAGYHRDYTGRLRVKRHSLQRGRLRVKRLYHTHHVRPRRY